jgi:hypothetical protein
VSARNGRARGETGRARAVLVAAGCALSLLFVSRLLAPSTLLLPLAPYACGDLARLAAGAWLRRYAAPGEVLETAFGLPAFAYEGPVYDSSQLNSAPSSPLLARAVYSIREGDSPPPSAEWELVALCAFPAAAERDSDPASKSNRYRVYAKPESRVRREHKSFGLEGRTDAPLAADDLPLMSRAWREHVRARLP